MEKTENNTFWDSLQSKSHYIETTMNPLERKRTGSYYTDIKLTDKMIHELVSNLKTGSKAIYNYRFLEPCVGSGNFVFSYLKEAKKLGLTASEAKILLNNIYVADINKTSLEGYIDSLKKIVSFYWGITLDKNYFEKHIGLGLLMDLTKSKLEYIPINKVFEPEIAEKRFDIIATNPPYKNLKAERSHYANEDEYISDREKYSSVPQIIHDKFQYSTEGVLNLYKLFVEEIIERYAADHAYVSLLIPSSFLSDKTCFKLRSHILIDMNLLSIKMIGEASGYIDAQQALSAILIKKGEKTGTVNITKDYCNNPDNSFNIQIEEIINKNTGNSIFALTEKENKELQILRKFPAVKDLDFIINLRGELDLTLNKKYITLENSGFRLLRGRNIDYYSLTDTEKDAFVSPEFIKTTKKNCYIQKERIACQQIANIHKERRITFALVPPDYILGNSCNFISIMDNEYGIDIYALLGLFNTKIINWLFKLTSSNNHVNNYEIDCFPIPITSPYLNQISLLVKEYLKNNEEALIGKIEHYARLAYGLSVKGTWGSKRILEMPPFTQPVCAAGANLGGLAAPESGRSMTASENETENSQEQKNEVISYLNDIHNFIPCMGYNTAEKILKMEIPVSQYTNKLSKSDSNVVMGITEKHISGINRIVLNHTTFKLSDLDLEMIQSVLPGGSWKDIPFSTVQKSKRLTKITQTGGRTTLYGRIDYNKPSYTITTYFNRPGNGTYIHPVHNRVLSVREAARFQTFRDDYYFFGNKTQLLKQVGNAVPPLLAYQIAREIKMKTGCYKSVDLFCGAGGMTVGFKAAGIKSLISNDIEESACTTLRINNPEIPVLCGDITQGEIKDIIVKVAKEGSADIICGGPPCQGFSMAGFRSENDPRNQLFREFVDIVKRVNPKVIVFENVEGILSYQGGKTYHEVHSLFSELGYNTEGRTLMANHFAVPQKRKRVIIICTRNDMDILPVDLFPNTVTFSEKDQVTAWETISDLENVKCDTGAKYVNTQPSDILQFFKGELSYEDYINKKSSKIESSKDNLDYIMDTDGQLVINQAKC